MKLGRSGLRMETKERMEKSLREKEQKGKRGADNYDYVILFYNQGEKEQGGKRGVDNYDSSVILVYIMVFLRECYIGLNF